MIIATRANMRDYARHGLTMVDTADGSEYSTDPNDYWELDPSEPLKGSDGDPMILVVKSMTYSEPRKDKDYAR